MGSVGNFLFGGSKQGSQGQNSSTSTSSSQNQSQNSSVNGSIQNSNSGNASASNSNGYNLAYGNVAASMNPTLGYTAAGGNMLGALLGIPGYSMTGGPAPADPSAFAYHPPTPVGLPTPPVASSGTSQLQGLISTLQGAPPPAPAHTQDVGHSPVPTTNPAGTSVPVTGGYTPHSGLISTLLGGGGGGIGTARTPMGDMSYVASRATGGPVTGAAPTLVGEQGPEVFVPHTSGTIIPNPGTSPQGDALNNYFNSAGGQFLMNKGMNAINSNASAGSFLQSGATGKALQDYGQGVASQYLNDYIGHTLDFAKLGLGGASAMTGAGNVNNSNNVSSGFGSSTGTSYGSSQGTSAGSSTGLSSSTGTTSSSGNSKKGIVPDILG